MNEISFVWKNTPNFDLFAKLIPTKFCLKCDPYEHESLGLALDTPIFNIFYNSKYLQTNECLKNICFKNFGIFFKLSNNPNENFSIKY